VTDAAPVSLHAFIDESRRGSTYLLATALLRPDELASTRLLMRKLSVAGARKVHFKHERDSIKKDIVAAMVSANVRARVYLGRGQAEAVREDGLYAAVQDLAELGLRRLVLDGRWEEGNHADRRIIRAALVGSKVELDKVTYVHMRSHEEPALWIADAIAWCCGAGDDWRRRVGPMVEAATEVVCGGR
jgi:hypothetical protein